MKSEKYREFLKHQAGKRPLRKSVSTERIILGVPHENIERTYGDRSSSILDSILLGKKMSQSVTVDRRAASLLQHRLNVLEEENIRMQRKIRFMKITIILMAAAFLSLCIYLMLFFI